jgi:hypothetical protein
MKSSQETLLPNSNPGEFQADLLKKSDPTQDFGQETTSMTLREFAHREPSVFEVIRTTTGREITREMFVGVIVKRKCSGWPRDGIGWMIVIGNTFAVDRVEGREQ